MIVDICENWCARTRMTMEYDDYTRVFQKDVNNYIIVPSGELYDAKGKERFKRKGAVVKQLNPLDNDLPIVNKAVVDYFLHNTPVETTVMGSDKLIDFQKMTKVGQKYHHAKHNDNILQERVNRTFASTRESDGTLFKLSKTKTTYDKVASTPMNCFIDNSNILSKSIPDYLDRQWYIDLAKERIEKFVTRRNEVN